MPVNKGDTKLQTKNFFISGLYDNTDIEIKRKAILLNVISIIGIINLVPLGISAIIREKLALGTFDLIAASVLIVLLVLLKKAEEALKDNARLLKATIESTADGILAVDEIGQVLLRNTRFGEMWTIPKDILKSNDDEKLLNFVLNQLKNPQMFISKIQELYQTDRRDFDTLDFKDRRVFERYSEPLIVGDNRAGRVWSFRDITERKRAEKERTILQNKLQQAQKMKAVGTLAGGVAHVLNNILSGIVSYPELILMDLPNDSPIRA